MVLMFSRLSRELLLLAGGSPTGSSLTAWLLILNLDDWALRCALFVCHLTQQPAGLLEEVY